MFETIVWFVHVAAAVTVIGLVLLQHGKGADVGAAFGSGSAGSLFGSSGAANFLSRTTAMLAAVFFATSLVLTYLSGHAVRPSSVMQTPRADSKPVGSAPAKPAVPVPAAGAGAAPAGAAAPAAGGAVPTAPAGAVAPAAPGAAAPAADSKVKDIPK